MVTNKSLAAIRRVFAARSSHLSAAVALAISCSFNSDNLFAADQQQFDIGSDVAGSALLKLAAAANVRISISEQDGRNVVLPALKGEYTLQEALDTLLAGSNLSYEFTSADSVVVKSTTTKNEKATKRESLSALEEVIVTAQKREQSVQDVPVAISAFSQEMLESRGVVAPQDLQFVVPGLTIGQGETIGTATSVVIRGVGSENPGLGGDPGVPLHIDGHYIQSGAYVLRDMLDVNRIEVLRGPQGTLYGRNAVGGSINIISNRPTKEFEASLGATLGNYNKRNLQAVISGPISENLRGRLVVADNERDGYVENLGIPGERYLDSNYTSVRGSLEFDLTQDMQVYLSAYNFEDSSANAIRIIGLGDSATEIADPSPRQINAVDSSLGGSEKSKGVSLDFSWDLGQIQFKSLSAYNDVVTAAPYDGRSGWGAPVTTTFDYQTFTQELQMLSNSDQALTWIAGVYYYDENSKLDVDIFSPFFTFRAPSRLESSSVAAFGQIDYQLTEKLQLSVGGRYTKDKKQIRRGLVFNFDVVEPGDPIPVPDFNKADDSWSQATYKIGMNYFLVDNVTVYGSFSTGFKSGGFNSGDLFAESGYNAETVDALEAGLKGQWLDDRLQINIAAFHYAYNDKQEEISVIVGTDPGTGNPLIFTSTTNAAKVTSYGAELEMFAQVTQSLRIDITGSYISATYDQFDTLDLSNVALGVQNLSGNVVNRTPEWTASAGAEYEWQLENGFGRLLARVDWSWTDEYYGRPFNLDTDIVPSYSRSNAKIMWFSDDDSWSSELYVKNIENDDDLVNFWIYDAATAGKSLKYLPPRTYGIKVQYNF